MSAIYLDYAATSPVRKEVADEIYRAMTEDWANPSAIYKTGREVKAKIQEVRRKIAEKINAESPDNIFFTSGGSEGNNMIIQGFLKYYPNANVITSPVEHKSIMECCKATCKNWRILSLNSNGMVNLSELENYLKYKSNLEPTLVVIQLVNNETGIVQPIARIAHLVHKYSAQLFTDAVQAFPHISLDLLALNVDFLSVSGHKFGCPKGIGFIYAKWYSLLEPLIYGSQERKLRGGTENVSYILGMGKAIELLDYRRDEKCDNRLVDELQQLGCRINGGEGRVSNIISCTLPEGVAASAIIELLGLKDICVSGGSACNASSGEPSYVLSAMGLPEYEIERTIRISYRDITTEQIDEFISTLSWAMNMSKVFKQIDNGGTIKCREIG